jgi:hypothetical protein
MLTEKVPILNSKYFCLDCDYYTSKRSSYTKHLNTNRHLTSVNTVNGKGAIETFECNNCDKVYKSRVGLWKHKKTCKDNQNTKTDEGFSSLENPTIIIEILKQNQEFKNLILEERQKFQTIITEQNAKMVELASNMGNNHHNTTNTTNTNSHNKFNLNVFLNEQCKDAMTLKDFVKNLEISMEEFINTGEHGFIEGLSQVMIKRINSMDIHDRPIHCTDLKRETVYIKDTDKWEKDANKEHLRKAVKGVAYKNERMRPIWYDNAPDVDILGSPNCEKFLKYSASALGGCGREETKAFEDKIMKNIMKEGTIDNHTLIV